ncbi:hypothetical protein PLICRDRAFT_180816 [Plicaturopsis crispa FD-325 SS-3]|uniref:Uncharacterized protein n=1 Tax=Plicaturopsis crispa FD-325 SS-3 TaxID=944288 RepID=A0A0C9SPV0_PLICR|nr:hypothetical protein PLICRDRAFT_180816 [Plicaturopsis crispa FD-325 SS-3]
MHDGPSRDGLRRCLGPPSCPRLAPTRGVACGRDWTTAHLALITVVPRDSPHVHASLHPAVLSLDRASPFIQSPQSVSHLFTFIVVASDEFVFTGPGSSSRPPTLSPEDRFRQIGQSDQPSLHVGVVVDPSFQGVIALSAHANFFSYFDGRFPHDHLDILASLPPLVDHVVWKRVTEYVSMHQDVYLFYKLHTEPSLPFRVTFIDGRSFVGNVQSRTFDDYLHYDFIYCSLPLSVHFDDWGLDGWSTYPRFAELLEQLSEQTPIFPPPRDVISSGVKFDVILELDEVARSLGHPRPTSVLSLHNPILPSSQKLVYKREGSDGNAHVIHVEAGAPPPELPLVPGLRWFVQPYNHDLLRSGEWRVYFLNGKIIWTAHTLTRPLPGGGFVINEHRIGLTLSAMTALAPPPPEDYHEDLLSNTTACPSLALRRQADEELFGFARSTYVELLRSRVASRRASGSSRSPLMSYFCRIDIGLFRTPEGRFAYFVNEIEECPSTSWMCSNPNATETMDFMVGEYTELFHTWYAEVKSS